MKSPFPGMDPYLEQYWRDIHARLILYACDQLEDQLPGNLIARVEERIVFETEAEDPRAVYPDVKIAEHTGRGMASAGVLKPASVSEPVIVHYRGEPATETFVEILEVEPGQRLVTVIELLSLTNKLPGEGQRQYRKKQKELHDAKVSLVEIDLLRGGERTLSLPASRIPRRLRTTYQVCVHRGWQDDDYEIYPVPLRNPLPSLRIPLRETDEDIRLDLQAILDLAYRKGRYRATIDYHEPPNPPLAGADAKWAKALMKKSEKG
jgi:Protein of unknown function (DUF4058)